MQIIKSLIITKIYRNAKYSFFFYICTYSHKETYFCLQHELKQKNILYWQKSNIEPDVNKNIAKWNSFILLAYVYIGT